MDATIEGNFKLYSIIPLSMHIPHTNHLKIPYQRRENRKTNFHLSRLDRSGADIGGPFCIETKRVGDVFLFCWALSYVCVCVYIITLSGSIELSNRPLTRDKKLFFLSLFSPIFCCCFVMFCSFLFWVIRGILSVYAEGFDVRLITYL